MAETGPAPSDASEPKPPDRDPRNISTIQFPYNDLDDAIELVSVIHGKLGSSETSPDQLAAAMNQVPSSGSFRLKVSSARIFGLVVTGPGKIELTDLAYEIVDNAREKHARASAFLNVELYRKVYDDFKGRPLPPRTAAFENMLVKLGVSPKQKDKARLVLDRSATQAGFYEHGKERLVMPVLSGSSVSDIPTSRNFDQPPSPPSSNLPQGSSVGIGSGGSNLNPFIQGLLETLPPPNTNWRHEGRAKWLQAAANIFELIYKGDGEITVQARSNRDEIE